MTYNRALEIISDCAMEYTQELVIAEEVEEAMNYQTEEQVEIEEEKRMRKEEKKRKKAEKRKLKETEANQPKEKRASKSIESIGDSGFGINNIENENDEDLEYLEKVQMCRVLLNV